MISDKLLHLNSVIGNKVKNIHYIIIIQTIEYCQLFSIVSIFYFTKNAIVHTQFVRLSYLYVKTHLQ